MEFIILGTSASIPTKERNVAGLFLRYRTEGLLFDCGEATQRQLNIAGISRQAVTRIFLTHWHGDHMGGLIGLLQTITHGEEGDKHIELYGPKGSAKRAEHLLQVSVFDKSLHLDVKELWPKGVEKVLETDRYAIFAAQMNHSTPCIGFAFVEKDARNVNMPLLKRMGVREGSHLKQLQEGKSIVYQGKKIDVEAATTVKKGKKFVYITDTYLCKEAVELAKDADILVLESTYSNALQEKAEQYKHLTSSMAATIAVQANVKKLILTHFSQRYKSTHDILDEATAIFPNTACAKDFMRVKL
ncbi:ribonuclease Z [Candidatus Woesearchaeota archaeon]|nr:ribonuclease Z [Candidatus Woesearchaeota archaeon]